MRKAIIKRSELTTKYHSKPTVEKQRAFQKQRNFCNRLYKKERKEVLRKFRFEKHQLTTKGFGRL